MAKATRPHVGTGNGGVKAVNVVLLGGLPKDFSQVQWLGTQSQNDFDKRAVSVATARESLEDGRSGAEILLQELLSRIVHGLLCASCLITTRALENEDQDFLDLVFCPISFLARNDELVHDVGCEVPAGSGFSRSEVVEVFALLELVPVPSKVIATWVRIGNKLS